MSSGLIVSVEAIRLLKWILENQRQDFEVIVASAMAHGCLDIDDESRFDSSQNLNDFQDVICDLINFLEQNVDKYASGSINMVPATEALLDLLSSSKLDPELILGSVRAVSLRADNAAKKGFMQTQDKVVKSILTNLLRKWRPGKKDAVA